MNLAHLSSYLAVIDTGSFRGAAEKLGISQPAVSQHIRKLEEQLGAQLVSRHVGGCVPTPQAEAFITHARSLLELSERARKSLTTPELIVGASSNVGIYLIQPVFKRFLEHSRGGGRLVIDTNQAIAEKLRCGVVDVAAMEWWTDEDTFSNEAWRDEELILIVAPDHRWANRSWLDAKSLMEEEILGGEPGTGTGRILCEALGSLANDLRVTRNMGSTEAVKEGVKAGLGVSLVMRAAVTEELSTGSLRAVPLRGVRLRKTIRLVRRSMLPERAPASQFCRFALAAA